MKEITIKIRKTTKEEQKKWMKLHKDSAIPPYVFTNSFAIEFDGNKYLITGLTRLDNFIKKLLEDELGVY